MTVPVVQSTIWQSSAAIGEDARRASPLLVAVGHRPHQPAGPARARARRGRPRRALGDGTGELRAISAPAALPDLLELARSWRPDVVVHDAAESPRRSRRRRWRGARHARLRRAAGAPGGARCRGGRAAVGSTGAAAAPVRRLLRPLYIDIYPPSLQPPGGDHVGRRRHLRPVAFDGATRRRRERDHATPGTPARVPHLRHVLRRQPRLPRRAGRHPRARRRAGVTVGPKGDPAAFGDQPSHVVVERYIPQSRLLGACDVVVSHAGSGTALAALAHGVSQLCLPQAQFHNAAAIARSGAGLTIAPGEVDAAGVTAAVRRLLHDPQPRRNARVVADEIAGMLSPEEVVGVIESLV